MQTDLSAETYIHEIIPSPGTENKGWSQVEEKLKKLIPFAKTIHIDICDGKFANNTTFMDPVPFKKYTSEIFFEVHLMVEDPIQYLQPFADAGFKRFLGHVEKMPDQAAFVASGQMLGEVGLAVDGPTDLSEINVPLDDLDALLCMSIKAGFSGQKFQKEFIQKLEMIKDTTWIPIEVDGGINDATIKEAADLGATRFACTSFILQAEDPKKQYELLQSLLVEK